LAPEARTLAGFGSPRPNDVLSQRFNHHQNLLSIASQTLQNSITTAQQLRGISQTTQTAIFTSLQAINQGWKDTFAKGNAAWNAYLRR